MLVFFLIFSSVLVFLLEIYFLNEHSLQGTINGKQATFYCGLYVLIVIDRHIGQDQFEKIKRYKLNILDFTIVVVAL